MMLGARASRRCNCECRYGGVQVSKEVNVQRRVAVLGFEGLRQWRTAEQVNLEVLALGLEMRVFGAPGLPY
eukprot:8003124-Pyramimonas_sp.AAC.1